jgi:membrane protease YdiL (CAAX protease family)
MNIRDHQREPLRRDLLLGLILLAIVMVVVGFRFIEIAIDSALLLLSFLVLFIFLTPYILSVNPTLLKVLRSHLQNRAELVWSVPLGLFAVAMLYVILAGVVSTRLVVLSTLYVLLPVLLFMQAQRQKKLFGLVDSLIVMLLWLPIEFGLLGAASLPPRQGIMSVYELVGLLLLIYFYIVLRELPNVGLTYRLKYKEVQLVIQSCVLFFIPALILGMPTEFIKLSHHVPGLAEMAGRFLAIGFFVALPEEILFRAIIQNALEITWQKEANGQRNALIVASVIFGLAHANNHNAPFINISFGSLGVWHFPWVYVLLATLAGAAYGWTFMKTRKVTAAALVHLLVDWVWSIFFNG